METAAAAAVFVAAAGAAIAYSSQRKSAAPAVAASSGSTAAADSSAARSSGSPAEMHERPHVHGAKAVLPAASAGDVVLHPIDHLDAVGADLPTYPSPLVSRTWPRLVVVFHVVAVVLFLIQALIVTQIVPERRGVFTCFFISRVPILRLQQPEFCRTKRVCADDAELRG